MRLEFDIDSYKKKKLKLIKILKVLMVIYVIIMIIPVISSQHRVRGIINLCTAPSVVIMILDKIEDIRIDIEKRKGICIVFENNRLVLNSKNDKYAIIDIFNIKVVRNKTLVKARVRNINIDNPIIEYTTTLKFSKYWEPGLVSVLNKYRLLNS